MSPRIAVTVAMALAAGSFGACAGREKSPAAEPSAGSDVRAEGPTTVAAASAKTVEDAGADAAILSSDAAQPASSEPRQRTLALLETLIRVKKVPDSGGLSAADKEENRKIFLELDDYFDFDKMIQTTIGFHAAKFNDEQLANFNSIFSALVRLVAYPRAGGFLDDCDKTIAEAKIDGKRVEVPMHASRRYEDLEMDVSFYWEHQDRWRLIDIAFDGVLLTKEYQNRIGRVIEEDGVIGLLRKIDKRRQEEQRVVQ